MPECYLYTLPEDQAVVEEMFCTHGVRCLSKFPVLIESDAIQRLVETIVRGQEEKGNTVSRENAETYRELATQAFGVGYYRAYRDLKQGTLSQKMRKMAEAYPEKKSQELLLYVRELLNEQRQLKQQEEE